MTSYGELMRWFKNQILSQGTWVTDPANFVFYESNDIMGLTDDKFPRLELQVMSAPNRNFIAQRLMDKECVYSVQGYIRRPEDKNPTDDEALLIYDFHAETEKLIYSIHDAVQRGDDNLPQGFVKISGSTNAYIEVEIEPRTSSFVFVFTADFSALDTQC